MSGGPGEGAQPRYIAVEGPIGAGKTTLARRLAARLDAQLLLEAPFENPFLPRFYANPRVWALSAQLSFLLQRARQMSELHQTDLFQRTRVADFVLEKDRLFARLNLDRDEHDLYEQVYARVIDEVPVPDVVIYLQAPVAVLLERIAERGVPYEQRMEAAYLGRLVEEYARFFADPERLPFPRVLVVNSVVTDLVNRDDHFERLLERLRAGHAGVQHFDPVSWV